MRRFVLCCVLFALPAAAQLDSAALRAKYGAPLHRETFHLPRGFDLIVDYGGRNQVCRLEVPAEMPRQPNAAGPFNPTQQMQDFLADLVPASMRGKELNRGMTQMSLAWASIVEYEHATIVETGHGDTRNPTTVRFKTEGCS
jgi:hypothetical protein